MMKRQKTNVDKKFIQRFNPVKFLKIFVMPIPYGIYLSITKPVLNLQLTFNIVDCRF
jgi:hypothetical protein